MAVLAKVIDHFLRPKIKHHRLMMKVLGPVAAHVVLLLLLSTGTVVGSTLMLVIPDPQVIYPQAPLEEPLYVSESRPLVVQFDRPIVRTIAPTMVPEIPGKWEYQARNFGPFLPDTLVFIPERSLDPEAEYSVQLENIFGPSLIKKSKAQKYLFVFTASPLQYLTETFPENENEDVRIDEPIKLTFDRAGDERVRWSFEIEPEIKAKMVMDGFGEVAYIEFEENLHYGTTYTVKILRTAMVYDYSSDKVLEEKPAETVATLSFKTVNAANIEKVSLAGTGVLPSSPLVITFTEGMDRDSVESALSLSPETAYGLEWEDERNLKLIPESAWNLEQKYEVKIGTQARTSKGGAFETEYRHEFSTIGAVKIVAVKPVKGAQGVSLSEKISVTFDQPVNKESAQANFSIEPNMGGNFSWQGNTMVFSPSSDLSPSTNYTLSLAAGIQSIYGKPSVVAFNSNFTSATQRFSLNVPLYKQHYTFTCYAAAAQMVLGFRGVSMGELDFVNLVGYDQTPRDLVRNIWGDPNRGVVGTYNGTGSGGYGVHWAPVVAALSKYRPVEVKRGWNIAEMLKEVQAGNPVMVWWVNGVWPAKELRWNTADGNEVYAVNGMHVEVVKGFIGDPNNPEWILTNDPWRGNRQYAPANFLSLWSWFGNTAVIVR